jgi:hypothetical protein
MALGGRRCFGRRRRPTQFSDAPPEQSGRKPTDVRAQVDALSAGAVEREESQTGAEGHENAPPGVSAAQGSREWDGPTGEQTETGKNRGGRAD